MSVDLGMMSAPDMGSTAPDMGAAMADTGVELDAGMSTDGGVDAGAMGNAAFAQAAANPGQWTWVPVPGAKCRDGSDTGFLVRLQAGATDLVMYLQGGGACFNVLTCAQNPSSFGPMDAQLAPMALTGGIFDSTNMDNPVAGWNQVFIPYCSGDVFGGTRSDVSVPGLTQPQQFVGADNMQLFTDLIVAELPSTSQVLLTGSSAGGYGANLNLERVITAFGTTPVHMLNDSGQPFESGGAVTSQCLTQLFFDLWGFQIPQGCTDCGPDQDGFLGVARHYATTYPMSKQALLSYTEDGVIRFFNAFGLNNCAPAQSPTPIPAADFSAGVLSLRTSIPSWGTYFVTGQQHTFLAADPSYQMVEVEMTTVAEYLQAFLNDNVQNVGP